MSNSKQQRKWLAKAMNCSESTANAPESCKRDDANGLHAATLNRPICSWDGYSDLFTILHFSILCVETSSNVK